MIAVKYYVSDFSCNLCEDLKLKSVWGSKKDCLLFTYLVLHSFLGVHRKNRIYYSENVEGSIYQVVFNILLGVFGAPHMLTCYPFKVCLIKSVTSPKGQP